MSDSPLEQVVFISLPETFHHHIEDLEIDSSRLLPVDTGGDPTSWNMDELTWEMILSGMLKVLTHQPEHEDADYYRQFVLKAKPEIVNELSETGVIKARNRQFDVAEEIFRALAGLKPDLVEPVANLALVYEQRAEEKNRVNDEQGAAQNVDRAYEIYRDILTRDNAPIDTHLNAGLFFFKQRDFERAREQLDYYAQNSEDQEKANHARHIVQEIDGQNLLDQLFKEAYDYIRLGQEQTGINRIDRFLEKNTGVWNAWFLRGWAHRRLGNFEEALPSFQKALDLGGDATDTRNELAICFMETGDYDSARLHLEAALRQEPENTKIISNLGVLALKQNNRQQAIGFFRTVLEIQPDDPVARSYIENLANETD